MPSSPELPFGHTCFLQAIALGTLIRIWLGQAHIKAISRHVLLQRSRHQGEPCLDAKKLGIRCFKLHPARSAGCSLSVRHRLACAEYLERGRVRRAAWDVLSLWAPELRCSVLVCRDIVARSELISNTSAHVDPCGNESKSYSLYPGPWFYRVCWNTGMFC